MFQELTNKFSPYTANPINKQMKLMNKDKRTRKWSDWDKTVALSLYYPDIKGYELK